MKVTVDDLASAVEQVFGFQARVRVLTAAHVGGLEPDTAEALAEFLSASLLPSIDANLDYTPVSRVALSLPGQGEAVIAGSAVAAHPLLAPFVAPTFVGAVARPVLSVAQFTNELGGPTFGDVCAWSADGDTPWGTAELSWPDGMRALAVYGVGSDSSPSLTCSAVRGVALCELGRLLRRPASELVVADALGRIPTFAPAGRLIEATIH